MGKAKNTYDKVMSGNSDNKINFLDLMNLLKHLGFNERISGGHHIFYEKGIPYIVNLQKDGAKAKGYQVQQVRQYFNMYGMEFKEDKEGDE